MKATPAHIAAHRNNNQAQTMTTQYNTAQAAAIAAKIEATRPRGAWSKAVKTYALELLENVESETITAAALLNGAEDWHHYSYGGSSLIYDGDIAERVCNPSELRRARGGELPPSRSESWLDCQARALRAAARLILRHT